MTMTPEGLQLLKRFEGCRLESYQDVAGIWTIGFGSTRYADGRRVGPNEVITLAEADTLFRVTLTSYEQAVDDLTRDDLTPHQFDALVSLTYNIGVNAFRTSTVRRLVNANPADPAIRDAFLLWNKAGGKRVGGLVKRRQQEADHYFDVYA